MSLVRHSPFASSASHARALRTTVGSEPRFPSMNIAGEVLSRFSRRVLIEGYRGPDLGLFREPPRGVK